jgi:hypothetical protein
MPHRKDAQIIRAAPGTNLQQTHNRLITIEIAEIIRLGMVIALLKSA